MPVFRTTQDAINQKFFENSIDLLLVTNRQGTFIQVSPSSRAILGYAPDDMLGRVGTEFVYLPDLDSVRQMMHEQRIHGTTRHFDCRYVHKDGAVVLLTWTGAWSAEEELHFFIGRDITEAREAEQYRLISREIDRATAAVGNLAKKLGD